VGLFIYFLGVLTIGLWLLAPFPITEDDRQDSPQRHPEPLRGTEAGTHQRMSFLQKISYVHKLMIQVRIWPDGDKQLSMSWWESPLVQRQIHRQTEESKDPNSKSGADKNQNRSHLEGIWREMKTSSCAAPK
jgi:hypothetical protein